MLLIALSVKHFFDRGVRQSDVVLDPLESLRHAVARRTLVPFDHGRGEASRQLFLAVGFGGGARRRQHRAKYIVRLAIGRTSPHRFAQPINRRANIALAPVGVSEIEEEVGFSGVGVGGLIEVDGRLTGRAVRRLGAAE